MALYMDEEDAWKCPKHPSKRRRTGICHVCLRDRLSSLCPDCANVRPCSCCTSSSGSSSSSSFSRFPTSSSAAADSVATATGTVGRISNLIESEPAFRRSRSLAIPFLRSEPAGEHDCSDHKDSPKSVTSFWSRLISSTGSRVNRSKRSDVERNGSGVEEQVEEAEKKNEDDRRRMMRKSRSVAVTSDSDVQSTKGKGWYFPSPIKAFKQSISRGIIVQERSPLYRG